MIFVEDLNLKGLARGFLGKHCCSSIKWKHPFPKAYARQIAELSNYQTS